MVKYNEVLEKINTQLENEDNIKASRHQDVNLTMLDFIESQWLPGDIKEVDCTTAYVTANFDTNGIGIIGSEREGWAICNGVNQLTKNRTGRVSVGYGTNPADTNIIGSFPTVGAMEGSKDAVVVEHTHPYQTKTATSVANNVRRTDKELLRDYYGDFTTSAAKLNNAIVGVSGTDKNLQPYIVTLFIQKL